MTGWVPTSSRPLGAAAAVATLVAIAQAEQDRSPWTCNHGGSGSWHRPKVERGCPYHPCSGCGNLVPAGVASCGGCSSELGVDLADLEAVPAVVECLSCRELVDLLEVPDGAVGCVAGGFHHDRPECLGACSDCLAVARYGAPPALPPCESAPEVTWPDTRNP